MPEDVRHIAAGQHPTLHPTPGITLQQLHVGLHHQAVLLQVEPGTRYDCAPHEGEELRYVIAGEVIFEVAGRDYPAAAGASLSHPSSVPHGFRTERSRATFLTFALAGGYERGALFRGTGAAGAGGGDW
jgi:mannose-6-phosphate isomerase-like protein (cupin superfamily)